LSEQWCLAPTADPGFVWHMEDVLSVYARPLDPARPVVCLDETSRQLLGEVRPPTPPAPGRPTRHDPEYARNGVANCFLVTEPLRGWRAVAVSAQRTRLDFAACVKDLLDVHYPAAERIVLVLDQLNTHSPASLYAAFPPAEAKRLADRLEIHHTPKHGSWLNMAEHGRTRAQRAAAPVPAATPRRPGCDGAGGDGLGRPAQRADPPHRLAIHHRRRAHQTPPALPGVRALTHH